MDLMKPPKEAIKLLVWVGIYDTLSGTDVAVYATKELAIQNMGRTVRYYWNDVVELTQYDRDHVPLDPPESDEEAVELYFDVMREAERPEFWTLELREVLTELP